MTHKTKESFLTSGFSLLQTWFFFSIICILNTLYGYLEVVGSLLAITVVPFELSSNWYLIISQQFFLHKVFMVSNCFLILVFFSFQLCLFDLMSSGGVIDNAFIVLLLYLLKILWDVVVNIQYIVFQNSPYFYFSETDVGGFPGNICYWDVF